MRRGTAKVSTVPVCWPAEVCLPRREAELNQCPRLLVTQVAKAQVVFFHA